MAWLYLNQGQQTGPVDDAALDVLVRQGIVSDDTLVWKDGMASWEPYAIVKPQVMNTVPMAPSTISPYLAALPQYKLYSPAGVALGALFARPLRPAFSCG